jgi:hypothetical protein
MHPQEYILPEGQATLALLGSEVQLQEQAPPIEVASDQAWLKRAMQAGKSALKTAIITAELLPVTNEGFRYGAFAYAQTVTNNPAVGAAVLGGSTLLVEGASALASADWVSKDKVKEVLHKVDNRLKNTKFRSLSPHRYIPESPHVSPFLEAGVGLTLGTVAVLELKQRENPERTAAQNVKRGMFTAGWLSAVFASEGALMSNGIENYHNPAAIGGALLGIAGVSAFVGWAKKRMRPSANAQMEEL